MKNLNLQILEHESGAVTFTLDGKLMTAIPSLRVESLGPVMMMIFEEGKSAAKAELREWIIDEW